MTFIVLVGGAIGYLYSGGPGGVAYGMLVGAVVAVMLFLGAAARD